MEYEDHLTISTPEGLELELLLAGVASRLIASLLDVLVQGSLAVAVLIAVAVTGSGIAQAVGYICLFALVFGYNILFETRASGRTPGKRWAGLRVILPSGRRITVPVSAVRNLLRLVDFLPAFYAVGVISILVSKRNQRVGDLAAGTIVVKDSDYLALWQIPGGRPTDPPPPPLTSPAAVAFAPATRGELALRRLDPELRRFVSSYARRRPELPPALRAQLAGAVQASLRSAAPDVFNQYGPLAALDHLADLEFQ